MHQKKIKQYNLLSNASSTCLVLHKLSHVFLLINKAAPSLGFKSGVVV